MAVAPDCKGLRAGASSAAPPTRCSPRARRWPPIPATCWSSTPIRRCCRGGDARQLARPPRRRRRHRRARLRGCRSHRLRPAAHRPRRRVHAIREDKDANDDGAPGTAVQLRRHGFSLGRFARRPRRIGNKNAKGEFYLTDAVEIARAGGRVPPSSRCGEDDVLGVNSREQLAVAEGIFQKRARLAVMRDGATLIAPETVWLLRHQDRPRRPHRAERVLRPRRHRRGRRRDQGQLPSSSAPHRDRTPGSVRSRACARRRSRRRGARRQLRRGEEFDAGSRAPRPTICRTSATARWARAPTSAPAPSSATTTASLSIAPRSGRGPSSAPILPWLPL